MRYQPGRPGMGSIMSRLTPGAAWLIAISVGVFVLYLFLGEATQARLLSWFALTPDSLARFQIWKLATTALLSTSGLTFFFQILMLWLFVPVLEGFWGTRRFLIFVAATCLVGNTVSALVGIALGAEGHLITGLTPFIYSAIVAYGVAFANQPVRFFGVIPIKGRNLAIGMVCFLLLFLLLERAWVDASGYFAAMGLAWAMTSGIWQPNVWWLKYRRWKIRRRYQVLDGGADKGPGKGPGKDDKKRWMN
jgi:membrane associated rhomboid family serine protease